MGHSHPAFSMGPQSLLVAQQLANAVGGVMSGAAQGMNQPILIPFNAGGHLGGQQGLVLSLPTANLQSLVAAAAAGGLMTLPLQNLQAALPTPPAQPLPGPQPSFARHPTHASVEMEASFFPPLSDSCRLSAHLSLLLSAVVSLIAVRAPHWACPLSIRTLIGVSDCQPQRPFRGRAVCTSISSHLLAILSTSSSSHSLHHPTRVLGPSLTLLSPAEALQTLIGPLVSNSRGSEDSECTATVRGHANRGTRADVREGRQGGGGEAVLGNRRRWRVSRGLSAED
ncbi:hypothetical protein F7725_028894 [Dissostichus mawsoni]|uniref:Uncharacterized protein n=1 Tax=Dissostichus mawsoni TaxID=36200 RepID=A0A7J5XGX1_DISMA|nr:hypothetical protein F7725_028894 [Dissostichus mawsoni]